MRTTGHSGRAVGDTWGVGVKRLGGGLGEREGRQGWGGSKSGDSY